MSWSFDCLSSEVTLISWSALWLLDSILILVHMTCEYPHSQVRSCSSWFTEYNLFITPTAKWSFSLFSTPYSGYARRLAPRPFSFHTRTHTVSLTLLGPTTTLPDPPRLKINACSPSLIVWNDMVNPLLSFLCPLRSRACDGPHLASTSHAPHNLESDWF